MTPVCIDLYERFGTRYRLRREADGVTWFETAEAERVWLLELPCRYGVVYPHGGDLLAAVVTGRDARRQVAALPCVLSRRGDTELVVTFHVDDAEAVLAVLKPYRRRQVTSEERERLCAMGCGTRFHGAESAPAEPGATQGARTSTCSTEPPDAGNLARTALGEEAPS